jgi:hypothetical protein
MQLEAGKYWIGDPCYVLDDTGVDFNWSEFVDFIFKGDPSGRLNEGVVQHQGIRFGFFSTAYGDGGYYDNRGNEYGVDAGMIACIPYDLIAPHFTDEDLNDLGKIHDFKENFSAIYDDGTIIYGHVYIETDPE